MYNYSLCKALKKKFNESSVLIFKSIIEEKSFIFRPDPNNLLAEILFKSKFYSEEKLQIVKLKKSYKSRSIKDFFIESIPSIFSFYIKLARDQFRTSNINFFYKNKKKLALIGGGYDWYKFSKNKSAAKEFSTSIERIHVSNSYEKNYKEINQILDKNIFTDGVSFFDFSELSNFIGSYLDFFIKIEESTKKRLVKFDAVISSVLTFPEENFIAHMAVKNNLPLYMWQHGEKGQSFDETILYTELFYATDYFLYADKIKNDYDDWIGKNYFKKMHVVGTIGKKIRWSSKDSNKVVYATGKWLLTATAFTDFVDPDYRMYRAHRGILGYLDNVIGREVILKANNTKGSNAIPYIKDYKDIEFDFDTAFTQLLTNAGVIILDTPATTLVEACSTEVPIFVLDGRNKYRENFLHLIKKRVIWCKTVDELILKLDLYFKKGIYEADVTDKSYLRGYVNADQTHSPENKIIEILKKGMLNNV